MHVSNSCKTVIPLLRKIQSYRSGLEDRILDFSYQPFVYSTSGSIFYILKVDLHQQILNYEVNTPSRKKNP